MATPWIKMRTDLLEDPRVERMSLILGCTALQVVGGCYLLWSLADKYSVDGAIPHFSGDALDARSGLPGFSDALRTVGWLESPESGSEDAQGGLKVPRFGEHNGQSAKRRAQEATRKSKTRASALDADTKRTRSESDQEQEEEQSQKSRIQGAMLAVGSEINSAELTRKIAEKPNFMRAFQILNEKSGIKGKNLSASVACLIEIDANGRDPLPILSVIVDKSKKAANPPGYIFSALKKEATR